MKHHHPERTGYTGHRNGLNDVEEREKLLNNLEALRNTTNKLSETVSQLHQLYEEIEFRKADLRALQVKLGGIAVKYGLERIATKSKSPKP